MTKRVIIFRLFLLLIPFLIIGGDLKAQPADSLSVPSFISYAREVFDVPGVAVGILKDGEIVLREGFGLRNTETGERVDSETIFGIASCTKAFTAASLATLVDDELFQWNDRVLDFLPEFELYDSCATNLLEIRDLLSHRSGLATFDGDLLWYGTTYMREEVVHRIRFRPPSSGIRTQFGYQNVMYITAGELIRQTTGKTWDQTLEERFFKPLGMESTNTSNRFFDASQNWSYPHIDGEPLEFLNYDNSGPAASINSNVEDLLKWIQLLLNKGIKDTDTLFSPEQYYKLTAPHTLLSAGKAETPNGTHFYAYGLGWFMYDVKGVKVIQHGGGLPGFHSKVVIVPEKNLGFVILANQLSGLVEAVYKRILDYYISESYTDWASLYAEAGKKREALQEEKQKQKEAKLRTGEPLRLKPDAYTGRYEDRMYGIAEVTLEKNMLYLRLVPTERLFHGQLEPLSENTFKVVFDDPFLPPGYVSFVYTDENQVDSFTIDLENPDFHFYKLNFRKLY
jgi:CubicO group peptidase (beta-lactamase class C family)